MAVIIILIFVLGYLLITLEHPLRLDKTVPALLMATLIWALLAVGFSNDLFSIVNEEGHAFSLLSSGENQMNGFQNNLLTHFGKTAEILVFLIGAMTIVEIIDLHRGFNVLKNFVKTTSKRNLLWIVGILGFFLSAVIDNLTATIVLITLLRKLIHKREERLWYVSLIVIAANSGGAWSPIGDVTTTMLWIANKVTVVELIKFVSIPAIISFVIPFSIASYLPVFKGDLAIDEKNDNNDEEILSSKLMLFLGIGMIIFVPIFKAITDLPPYMGMMFALGIVWLVSEYIQPEENFSRERRHLYSAHRALSRIEISSILFFLGILMAVAGLESLVYGTVNGVEVGTLRYMAEQLQQAIPNQDLVIIFLGMLSAVIDNVPLVAASMGMYDSPTDSVLWHFIAYAAGTGGSMLIIGSAAGVAAMGMERIDFIWFLRKITWLAFLGFIIGAGVFLLIERMIFHNV
ncbi:MAG: sodium:proton antiporter [Bacteroidetes bacterium]|nr:sodium:proton antiporter [Bacteroidota bacterium]